MGYYLYAYGGSGDHGSEDRIRGTCRLLSCRPAVVTAYPEAAYRRGLAALADLTRQPDPQSEDTCLIPAPGPGPGRRVLWCWAQTVLPPKSAEQLDAVVVTNTDAYQALRRSGLGQKVRLGPDPTFLVERKLRPLQGLFRRDTVGLCFSGDVRRYENRDGLLFASYCHLIRSVLAQTSYDIVLIPYCCRRLSDCLLLQVLERQFRHTGRVFLRPDGDSPCLRGDLSLCRFVIGSYGATAAWSCGVPALCIGADPGALGLAADLFGDWQDGVLPVAWLKEEQDLTQAVFRFFGREDALRRIMDTTVPYRRQRSLSWSWRMLSVRA